MSDENENKHAAEQGRKKKALLKIRIILIAIVAILIIAIITAALAHTKKAEEPNSVQSESIENESSGFSFPYNLAEGRLRVDSLFQYSGLNPDCNNEEGEDIAALEIVNQSDEFCKSAEIEIAMQDGTELVFKAEDIPAGKKIWVFESSNQSIGQDDACKEIRDNSEFGEVSFMESQITTSVEDTTITIENLTGEEITDLTVGCHCLFEDTYFGGVTYSYPTGTIPAGGRVIVDAVDCYMGSAEVVWISNNEE